MATKKATKAAAKKTAAKAAKTPAKSAAKEPTKPAQAAAKREPTHEEIAIRAEQLWRERGGHHGSHGQDWMQAEQELKG